jgi:DNA mismatch repair ATPase MutL
VGFSVHRGFAAATLDADGMDNIGADKEAALMAATKELERSFNKADFKRMKVGGAFPSFPKLLLEKFRGWCEDLLLQTLSVACLTHYFDEPQVLGQFNLGFILARLDQDLFIIDQVLLSLPSNHCSVCN